MEKGKIYRKKKTVSIKRRDIGDRTSHRRKEKVRIFFREEEFI